MTAGAARADFERADLVDPRDAAAAGADLDDVDDRQHDRMSARERRRCSSLARSSGSLFCTRLTLAVVPPMSNAITLAIAEVAR